MRMTTKRGALVFLFVAGALGLVSAAGAHECPACPSFSNPTSSAAKQLASLVGCWTGRGPDGVAAAVTYKLASGGSALIEDLSAENQEPVHTVYHLDGDTAMAEHYCSLGNQVRMRSEASADEKVLTLRFFEATNRSFSPTDSHMTYVKFNFRDAQNVDVEWGLFCGDDEIAQPFAFTKVDC